MSEPIPAEIWIGGKTRREQVPQLCKAIEDAGVALEWGDAYFAPETGEELETACQDKDGVRLLCLCDDQANYGEFKLLEEFLVRERITYRRKSDAKYEFDAEVVEHRPQVGQVRYPSDSSGQPFVPLATMMQIAATIDEAANTAQGQTALELLRRLRNVQQLLHEALPVVVPPLEPFEIVG
ncbi:MAG TPA: hypothetical protein VGY55_00475 [Pirellulales bacterium]|jgi:hypothetical protein|nr:hypothetical protein [Pirellulales bacterium]